MWQWDDGGSRLDTGQTLFDELLPAERDMGVAVPGGGAVEGDFDDDGRGVHHLRVPSGVVQRLGEAE